LTLRAVLDDSGTKGTGKVLMFGGLLGAAEAIAEMSDDWDRELRAQTPLPIRHFKAYEARSLTGEFANWSRKKRDEKLGRLVSIIDRSDLKMILCGVDLASHKQTENVVGKALDAKHHPFNQPYLLALLLAMFTIAKDASESAEKFEVIVDEHVIFRKDALRFWDITREMAKPSLKELIPVQPLFRDDQDFVALQADLLMGNARMTLEKTSRWPALDFKNLKVYGTFAEARSLSQIAARQIERQLQLPPNSIRMRVRYPDGRDIDAITGESDV
jgi:hypothetical protein